MANESLLNFPSSANVSGTEWVWVNQNGIDVRVLTSQIGGTAPARVSSVALAAGNAGIGISGGPITSAGSITVSATPGANAAKTVAAPVAPANLGPTYTMQGLKLAVTPARTGNVLLTASGYLKCSLVAGDGIEYQLAFGTGTAPNNGDALTGAVSGPIQVYTNPVTLTNTLFTPFSVTGFTNTMTVGTTYWVDIIAAALGHVSTGSLHNVYIAALEL